MLVILCSHYYKACDFGGQHLQKKVGICMIEAKPFSRLKKKKKVGFCLYNEKAFELL